MDRNLLKAISAFAVAFSVPLSMMLLPEAYARGTYLSRHGCSGLITHTACGLESIPAPFRALVIRDEHRRVAYLRQK